MAALTITMATNSQIKTLTTTSMAGNDDDDEDERCPLYWGLREPTTGWDKFCL